MSFFKKLFGGNEKSKKETPKSQPTSNPPGIFNNLGEYGFPDQGFLLTGNQGMDVMSSIGKLGREMQGMNKEFNVKGFFYTKLFEGGALKVPVVFESKGKGYSLFYLYNEEQVKQYNDAKDWIAKTDFPNPVYISQIDSNKITAKSNALGTYKLSDLSYNEKPELSGDYGMWWSTENDQQFHSSKSKESLDGIFNCIRGYESYMFGYLLSEIKMKGFEEFQRVGLPEEPSTFVVKGPEYLDIVISVSQEKGIKFHFPKEKASQEYRELFLHQINSSLHAFQIILSMKEVQKDEETDPNPYDWYSFMARVIEKKEKSGEIEGDFVIGSIGFN